MPDFGRLADAFASLGASFEDDSISIDDKEERKRKAEERLGTPLFVPGGPAELEGHEKLFDLASTIFSPASQFAEYASKAIMGGYNRAASAPERVLTGESDVMDKIQAAMAMTGVGVGLAGGQNTLQQIGSDILRGVGGPDFEGRAIPREDAKPTRTESALSLLFPGPTSSLLMYPVAGAARGRPLEGIEEGLKQAYQKSAAGIAGVFDEEVDFESPAKPQVAALLGDLGVSKEGQERGEMFAELLGTLALGHAATRKPKVSIKAEDATTLRPDTAIDELPKSGPRRSKVEANNPLIDYAAKNAADRAAALANEETIRAAMAVDEHGSLLGNLTEPFDPSIEIAEGARRMARERALAEAQAKAQAEFGIDPNRPAYDPLADVGRNAEQYLADRAAEPALPPVGPTTTGPEIMPPVGRGYGVVDLEAVRRAEVAPPTGGEMPKAPLPPVAEAPAPRPAIEINQGWAPHEQTLARGLAQAITDRAETIDLMRADRTQRAAALNKSKATGDASRFEPESGRILHGKLAAKVSENRPKFKQSEIEALKQSILDNPNLSGYDAKRTLQALDKLTNPKAEGPIQNYEIGILSKAFPHIGEAITRAGEAPAPPPVNDPGYWGGIGPLPDGPPPAPAGNVALGGGVLELPGGGVLQRPGGVMLAGEARAASGVDQVAAMQSRLATAQRALPAPRQPAGLLPPYMGSLRPEVPPGIHAPSALLEAQADLHGTVKTRRPFVTASERANPPISGIDVAPGLLKSLSTLLKTKGALPSLKVDPNSLGSNFGNVRLEWGKTPEAIKARADMTKAGVKSAAHAAKILEQVGFPADEAAWRSRALFPATAGATPSRAANPTEERVAGLVKASTKVSAERMTALVDLERTNAAREGRLPDFRGIDSKMSSAFEPIRGKLTVGDLDRLDIGLQRAGYTEKQLAKARDIIKHITDDQAMIPPNVDGLALLHQAYPDLARDLNGLRPMFDRAASRVIPTTNVFRNLMAGGDHSMAFMQSFWHVGSESWRKAFGESLHAMGDEGTYTKMNEAVMADREVQIGQAHGLAVAPPEVMAKQFGFNGQGIKDMLNSTRYTDMDPSIPGHSNIPERLPGIVGRAYRASNRAGLTMLNVMRKELWKKNLEIAKMSGDPLTQANLKAMAQWINRSTGHGDFFGNKFLQKHAEAIPLFAPRYVSSRFESVLSYTMWRDLPKAVRARAVQRMMITAGAHALAIAGVKAMGGEVGTDPHDGEFGKWKIGNSRLDLIGGGYGQNIRFITALASGYHRDPDGVVSFMGDDGMKRSKADEVYRYLRTKAGVASGMALNILHGKTIAGDKVGPWTFTDYVEPMVLGDIADSIKEHGPAGILLGIPSLVGIPVATYQRGGERAALEESLYRDGKTRELDAKAKDIMARGEMTGGQYNAMLKRVTMAKRAGKFLQIQDLKDLRASVASIPPDEQQRYGIPILKLKEMSLAASAINTKKARNEASAYEVRELNRLRKEMQKLKKEIVLGNQNPNLPKGSKPLIQYANEE